MGGRWCAAPLHTIPVWGASVLARGFQEARAPRIRNAEKNAAMAIMLLCCSNASPIQPLSVVEKRSTVSRVRYCTFQYRLSISRPPL